MANQKQRRRRLKEKRHDYDLVEIDADGAETVVRSSALKPAPDGRKNGGKGSSKPAPKRGRTARVPQPPSWRRVAKRAGIFAPIFLVAVMLLGQGEVSLTQGLINTVALIAVFVPLSYLMDGLTWRIYRRRLEKG